MPYIKPADKRSIEWDLVDIVARIKSKGITKGELNYIITRLAIAALNHAGKTYQNVSDYRAAMDDASAEWYRRVMAPYEDKKAKENGDVFKELKK